MLSFDIQTETFDINELVHETIKGTVDDELTRIIDNCFHAHCNCPELVNEDVLNQSYDNRKFLNSLSNTTFTDDKYTVRYVKLTYKFDEDDYDDIDYGVLFSTFNAEHDWFTHVTNELHADIHNTILNKIGTPNFTTAITVVINKCIADIKRRYDVIKHMFVIRNTSDAELAEWCATLKELH